MAEAARVGRTVATVLGVLLVVVLGAHFLLAWRIDTGFVAERLNAGVLRNTDSLYRARIRSAKYSLLGRTFEVTGVELYPDSQAFRRRQADRTMPRTRYHVRVGTLRASGIGLRPLLGRGLTLGAAVFDSLELDIRYDHLVAQKRDTVPGLLPHQRLQRVRDPVRIGHLVIRNSRFHYYDRAADGSRFGVLRFDSLNLRIRNISNSPLAMSAQRPSVVDVRAAFMGVGPLTMRFAWDLSSEPLNLSYEGSLGRMDVRALNQLLVDYQGVRIQSGRVDSIWFNVDVRDDKAKGKLQARYHDLEIELVDKQSRDQGLGDMIRSIFANWKLRGSNPSDDDEPVRTASLALSRQPDNSLFRFLWNALRQGLYETIGYGG